MNRILIDTMHLGKLIKDNSYLELAGAISDGDIEAICSVVSLLELTKRLGMIDDELCHMNPGWINTRKGTITIQEEERVRLAAHQSKENNNI